MSEKEMEKYIQKMKSYTTSATNFSPAASSNSLKNAGIIDKDGKIKEPYMKPKIPRNYKQVSQ